MSIKSKDLSFNKQDPPFLRRLRESNSGLSDLHERPQPRPQRLRDPNASEEDAPTYVDEDGSTLSKAEYEALLHNGDGETDLRDAVPTEDVGGAVRGELSGTEPVAAGGISGEVSVARKTVVDVGRGSRKRKVVTVVGDEDEGTGQGAEGGDEEAKKGTTTKTKTKKKKGKPIKLSFGDDEA